MYWIWQLGEEKSQGELLIFGLNIQGAAGDKYWDWEEGREMDRRGVNHEFCLG